VNRILLIALAGALGTLARYGLGGLVQRSLGSGFPWGTFAVNVIGCFLFGCVWALAEERFVISSETRFIVLVGFMGAFTTFSTFVFESRQLVAQAEWFAAALNIVGQVAGGIAALVLGLIVGRFV
jgi:CrcB protein